MYHGSPSTAIDTSAAPVACERLGEMVRWMSGSRSVEVELVGELLEARFLDAPARDSVTGESIVPVYRHAGRSYGLDRSGSQRMGRDIDAFFAGEREPSFHFTRFEVR